MTTKFEPPGTLPRPGVIGRGVRSLLALLALVMLVSIVRQASDLLATRAGWRIPGGDWWVAAIACLWFLSGMVDQWVRPPAGRWTQAVFLGGAALAVVWDRVTYGVLWAAPLGLLVLALFVFVLASAGVSFAVAAIVASPG